MPSTPVLQDVSTDYPFSASFGPSACLKCYSAIARDALIKSPLFTHCHLRASHAKLLCKIVHLFLKLIMLRIGSSLTWRISAASCTSSNVARKLSANLGRSE